QIEVPLPKACPDCGGRVVHDDTQPQFQEDIVRQTIVRRFDVQTGHCTDCERRVQGRHPLQTSDALGAAQVQVGPQALTLAAHLEWLWVCVSAEVTVYAILPGRGFAQAASILGEDYSGFLNHDGWQPYYRFADAFRQTCLSHLIRRCKDMIEMASAVAARF